jgi:hypothetical protein
MERQIFFIISFDIRAPTKELQATRAPASKRYANDKTQISLLAER